MYQITVEGIYESSTGINQSKFIPFNLTFEVCRMKFAGIETHIEKRLIPYLLKTKKEFKANLFTKLQNYRITTYKKLEKECELFGKKVMELDEFELQQLATLYDLYEAPLAGIYSLQVAREMTALAYFKKVLGISLKTPKEKLQAPFLIQNSDGSFKPDFSKTDTTIIKNMAFFKTETKEMVKKIDVNDYIKAIEQKNKDYEENIFSNEVTKEKEEIDNTLDNLNLE